MNKEVRICHCGSIHLIEENVIFEALEEDKEVLLICAHCGSITVIGADIEKYNDKTTYNRYAQAFGQNRGCLVLSPEEFKHNKEVYYIIYDRGILVPMMTGEYANLYYIDTFFDTTSPDFSELEHFKEINREVVAKFLKDYRKNNRTVNMNSFLRDNRPEDLKILSKFLTSRQFNWSNTPYKSER